VVLERTITPRGGFVPEVHAHTARSAVCWCGKVGVVEASTILDRDGHAVIANTSRADVGLLEVVGRLSESILVSDIVNRVDDVECVDGSGVHLRQRKRVFANLEYTVSLTGSG
jgi:hypothetical protein